MIEEQMGFGLASLLRGLLGIASVIGVTYLLSSDRKKIDWKLVGGGLLMQFLFVLAILYIPLVGNALEGLGRIFIKLMDFTQVGLVFLLGPYASKAAGFAFLLHTLPIVIFFSAIVSVLYYWGIIQWVVNAFSWLLSRFMNISGSEGLVVSGNIFLGMTESPVLIKNYLPSMNRSEILLVMVSGMGTISGAVMGMFVSLLGQGEPVAQLMFAKHLLAASVMAAPGAIVVAKIICPQTEPIVEHHDLINVSGDKKSSAFLGALTDGTVIGVKLMVNIAAMLLVFISLVALMNYVTEDLIGYYTGLNKWIVKVTDGRAEGLTFQFILGVLLAPFMWLIGVPSSDIMVVGSLLGQKTILNEVVAYSQMQVWKESGFFIYQKSIIMSTYILCGFANIGSMGILLGGLTVLAPNQRSQITRLGISALIGGAMVSVLSATIIGMILG